MKGFILTYPLGNQYYYNKALIDEKMHKIEDSSGDGKIDSFKEVSDELARQEQSHVNKADTITTDEIKEIVDSNN